MIGVGLNENVVLSRATTTEKGALEIGFDYPREKVGVFESLQTAKVENDGTERTILIFPAKKPTGVRNDDKTDDELIEMVSADLIKTKNQLTQLCEQFLTSDKIVWNPYAGTGVDNTNYRERFLDDDTLSKVSGNYFEQFIGMVTPFLNNPAYKLRVKLVRQSKDKHFATIPGKFLADNPWVELMDVPTPMVKFTKWEIDNKFDDGTPVSKPAAVEDVPPPEGDNAFKFGQR